MAAAEWSVEVTFRQIKGADSKISRRRMFQVENGEEDLSYLGTHLVWQHGEWEGHTVGERSLKRRQGHCKKMMPSKEGVQALLQGTGRPLEHFQQSNATI